MHSVLFAPTPAEADLLLADLYERGTAGVIEEGSLLRAFFDNQADYRDLLSRYPVVEMRAEPTTETATLEVECDPILVGQTFFIVPAASRRPTPSGRHRLTIHDSNSFGTGRHETTQLMLAALEQILITGQTVLDIGSGSGILSKAAQLLGADKVWSCDIYEPGLRSANRDYRRTFIGSADAVATHTTDVTLANITAPILDALAYELKRVTRPGGRILISGFLNDAPPQQFHPHTAWDLNGWLCWLCDREGIQAAGQPGKILIHNQNWW